MELKEIIKKDLGLTQKKFAEEIGVFENTVNNWCIGNPISPNNIKKIVGYYQNKKISTENFSKYILEKLGLSIPIEKVEIAGKKEVDKLNSEIVKLKEKCGYFLELYNNQVELNELYKKEIGLNELKQWNASGTARVILDSKEFTPIVDKLLEEYSEIDKNRFQAKMAEIVKNEVKDIIIELHNKALEKEKKKIKERIKSVKKCVTNLE